MTKHSLVVGCLLLSAGISEGALTIYGSAHTGTTGPASLYSISPTTGSATLIGSIGFNQVGALAINSSGTLYGIGTNGSRAAVLLTINTATGAGTQVALITGLLGSCCGVISDMDFRPSDGVLFAREGSDQGGHVYTINTATGAATLVGIDNLSNSDGNAMAFSSSNILYSAGDTNLHTINQSTAAGTLVTGMTYSGFGAGAPRANAMKFDAVGTLYATVVNRSGATVSYLGTINVSTGVATAIGVTTTGMDGMAVTGTGAPAGPPPVVTPAPSALLLIGTGLMAVLAWHRRRTALRLR